MQIFIALISTLLLVVVYDLIQRKKAILRNFPLIGHLRYLLEAIGPELRQYIVTNNNEERPFSRDQRRWIYASAKKQDNYFSFGTDEDLEKSSNYLIIKHAAFPLIAPTPTSQNYDTNHTLPCAKILGEHRNRAKKFRPQSIVNISGMSYGSLSANATEALNRGAQLSGCIQSTGEGGVSSHHDHGGELIWQIGTGYFGCRDQQGNFSMSTLKEKIARYKIKAIEIKLSQGAKPGAGGILPRTKITPEIAKIRGISLHQDCVSPSRHSAFSDPDSLLDFAESIAEQTGLPVGIKSAVGDLQFWHDLARLMSKNDRGLDFINIDGGEGGTGAAPLVFTDHISFPFKVGFSSVYKIFAECGLADKVVFVGAGKLGWPETAVMAFALGVDFINVGRSAMLAIGCIQAQRCHTNRCPTGVATNNKWLMRGLDPQDKSARLANYIISLRKELQLVSFACGLTHPAFLTPDHLEFVDDKFGKRTFGEVFGYKPEWGRPNNSEFLGL